MDPPLPPLPPINNNTVGSVNVAVESFDLDNSARAIAASVADDFFRSAFIESGGSQDRFLGEGSPDDNGTNTDESPASTSAPYQVGVLLDGVAAENKVLASGVSFLTEQPFFENHHNQKTIKTKKATPMAINPPPRPPPLVFDGANESNNQRNNYWLLDLPLQIRPRNALMNE